MAVTLYANKTSVISVYGSGSPAGEIAIANSANLQNGATVGDQVIAIGFDQSQLPDGAIISSGAIRIYAYFTAPDYSVNQSRFLGYTLKSQFNEWSDWGGINRAESIGTNSASYIPKSPEWKEISISAQAAKNAAENGIYIYGYASFGMGQAVPGSVNVYSARSSFRPEVRVEYKSPTISVSPGFSDGLFLLRNKNNTVSWSMGFSSNTLMHNYPKQTNAEVRCKQSNGQIKTISVWGESKSATIPAGTFTGDSGQIQIAVATTAGGYAESPWITVDTKEEVNVWPSFTDGLFIAKNIPKEISWTIGWGQKLESLEGAPEQVSAQIRCNNGSSTKTINVSGKATVATIPAGTFTGDSGQIQIAVSTFHGGYAESNWVTVNTKDELGTAVASSPRGIKVDGDINQTFEWTYESPTGTPQSKAELQVSYDGGGRWQELISASGNVRRVTIPAGTLEAGSAAWRVRCFNSDGNPGEYSDGAYIIVAKSPVAPGYVTTNAKPHLLIEWASTGQQGYQVQVVRGNVTLYDSGTVFGLEKYLKLPFLLENGDFIARVRIIDKQGIWSGWKQIASSIQNISSEPIAAYTKKKSFGLTVEWFTEGEYQSFYILRDGVPVGKVKGSKEWTDWTANGKHKYIVRGIKDDGFYTDSPVVVGVTSVPYGAICTYGDFGHWMVLKLHEGSPFSHSENRTSGVEYVQYVGHSLPVPYPTGWKTITHIVEYTVRTKEEWDMLKSMEGEIVIYKDFRGARVIGMLESVDASHTKRTTFSLTIIETDVEERVNYD